MPIDINSFVLSFVEVCYRYITLKKIKLNILKLMASSYDNWEKLYQQVNSK